MTSEGKSLKDVLELDKASIDDLIPEWVISIENEYETQSKKENELDPHTASLLAGKFLLVYDFYVLLLARIGAYCNKQEEEYNFILHTTIQQIPDGTKLTTDKGRTNWAHSNSDSCKKRYQELLSSDIYKNYVSNKLKSTELKHNYCKKMLDKLEQGARLN